MTENARHAKFRQWVLAAATAIVAILIVIAVAFATQEHNARVLMEDLDRTGVARKHVSVFRSGERLELVRRPGFPRIDLTPYLIRAS
jgi:hypothetical protein